MAEARRTVAAKAALIATQGCFIFLPYPDLIAAF
jgi:hypothetical protein